MLADKFSNMHPYLYMGLNKNLALDASIKRLADKNPQTILHEVCKFFNVPIEMVISASRKRELVIARQTSMLFLRQYTKLSLKAIGGMLGGRDHSTCLYAIDTINNLCDTDKKFNKQISECRNHLLLLELKP